VTESDVLRDLAIRTSDPILGSRSTVNVLFGMHVVGSTFRGLAVMLAAMRSRGLIEGHREHDRLFRRRPHVWWRITEAGREAAR
jgi:hypothetical protein